MVKCDLVKALSQQFEESPQLVESFNGAIEPDGHPDFFRLYPTPNSRMTYYRIPKSAEKGIYEWTTDEILHAHIQGQRRFRVDIAHGELIQKIDVKSITVGATPVSDCGGPCNYDTHAYCEPGCGCNRSHGNGTCVPV